LKIREKRLKDASKKLSEAKIDHKFKIPEDVQFIPYFLSEVAKDQKLAKDVWMTIEDLANKDWDRVYSKWDSGETTQHAEDRKYAIVTIYSGKHLAPKDVGGFSDPYLKIYYGPENNLKDKENCRESIHKKDTLTPVWGEKTITYPATKDNPDFPNVFVLDYKDKAYLRVECWDKDKLKEDNFMGLFQIPASDPFDKKEFFLKEDPDKVKTTARKKPNPKKKKKTFVHVSGTICISLAFADKSGEHIKEIKRENE